MNRSEWLSALSIVFTVVAILAAPVIALWVGAKLQKRSDAQKAKVELFGTIVGRRHDLLSAELVRALNSIDFIFVDYFAVRETWCRYYSLLYYANLNIPPRW